MNEKQFQKLQADKMLPEYYFIFFKEFVFLIPHPLPFASVKHE